ncbi:hypothetical protein BJ980_000536 [Nocardioides daedukensis]|uniref:Hemophore-related protein n=1 Tax=Nocardioides daedukensis TaxID=634462 RepID=A0A7Y9UML1_9ACTN|nr:hypothetical protein [Nocardioides daedukensis]NYG57613.1 hypothetical protein [Nocardioides daedukensis]
MRRTTLARLAILLAVGPLAACGTDDGDRGGRGASSTTGASSGSSPSGSATSPTAAPSDPTTATASPSVPAGKYAAYCTAAEAANDAETIDDLQTAVADLVRLLPTDASDEARAGLVWLNDFVQKATSLDQMGSVLKGATAQERKQVAAYGEFEEKAC